MGGSHDSHDDEAKTFNIKWASMKTICEMPVRIFPSEAGYVHWFVEENITLRGTEPQ